MVFALLVANTVVAADQFTLKGKVDGVVGDSAVLSYWTSIGNQSKVFKYTSKIRQGHFLFKEDLRAPVEAQLEIGGVKIRLYLEPTEMELYIPKSHPEQFRLKGSETHDDGERLAKGTGALTKLQSEFNDQIQKKSKKMDSIPETDPAYKKLLDEKDVLKLRYDSVSALIGKLQVEFIRMNPNSYYPIVSNIFSSCLSRSYISVDSARILFDRMPETIRNSSGSRFLNFEIKMKENVVVGKMAPDFNTPDMNEKLVKLSDYRVTHYVLLDFWASWCVYCVKGLPHMNELYNKYHNKGLELIGVSCDWSKADWLTAVDKHQIGAWPQVSIVQSLEKAAQGYLFDEDIQCKYPTDGIPKYILIDKTGKIIAKWEGYSEENEKNQDKVLKEVFGE